MDQAATSRPSVILPIPEEGLFEVLRAWSGKGRLWEALAAVEAEEIAERDWTAKDVESRAQRILFEQLLSLLLRWPISLSAWINYLPAESVRVRSVSVVPTSGTSWRDTRLLGWPPREFVGHSKNRESSTLLVTTLKWTIERLIEIRDGAVKVEPEIDESARRQLEVAQKLLHVEPLASAEGITPARADITAVRSEGKPWSAVASVADALRRLTEATLTELARRLVMPSDDLRWRLFHLSILGKLLLGLQASGASITSIRPLAAFSGGPAYTARAADGSEWDIWFEAAGAYRHYRKRSPYLAATRGVRGENRPLGADLLLIRPDDRALIIECKYSDNPSYIGRYAYQQTVCYAAEVMTQLAPNVISSIVVPEGAVSVSSKTDLIVGTVGVNSPDDILGLVSDILTLGIGV